MGTIEDYLRAELANLRGAPDAGRHFSLLQSDRSVVQFMRAYVAFNRDFAPCVASLAGAIGLSQDIFQDGPDATDLDDRGLEVASHVFFSVIDEFWDRERGRTKTHRSMAQFFLRELLCFYRIDPHTLGALPREVRKQIARIRDGYRVDGPKNDTNLFHAIGFHIGSECMADLEFNTLDRLLCERHPALVAHLERVEDEVGDSAYFWLRLHKSVEAEHYEAALRAASAAVETYRGPLDSSELRDRLVGGIHDFFDLQQRFLDVATQPSEDRGRAAA